MTKRTEIYECKVCGNVIEILETGNGTLVCCDEPMEKLNPTVTEKEGYEKHLPVISKKDDELIVRVGEIEHPMQEEHYINTIQIIENDVVIAEKSLKPGVQPKAIFYLKEINSKQNLSVRIFCNIHGVWVKEINPISIK